MNECNYFKLLCCPFKSHFKSISACHRDNINLTATNVPLLLFAFDCTVTAVVVVIATNATATTTADTTVSDATASNAAPNATAATATDGILQSQKMPDSGPSCYLLLELLPQPLLLPLPCCWFCYCCCIYSSMLEVLTTTCYCYRLYGAFYWCLWSGHIVQL